MKKFGKIKVPNYKREVYSEVPQGISCICHCIHSQNSP